MPSIAASAIELTSEAVSMPEPQPVTVAAPVSSTPLRSVLPSNDVLDTVTSQALSQLSAGVPSQPVWKVGSVVASTVTSSSSSSSSSTSTTTANPSPGVPDEVYEPTAIQTPYKTSSGLVVSLVSVSFKHWANDQYYGGVQIWFTGYHGNPKPQLMATSAASPATFTCDATKEMVTITIVAISPSGVTASFTNAPSTTVLLSGTVNAPPAPNIVVALTAIGTNLGWQFTYDVEGGLLQDVIAGYWIYKSSTNTTPVAPAGRYQYQPQPATNIGTMTFQDLDSTTEYYWVSAVSVSGLESSLSPANVSTVANTIYPSAQSGDYYSPTSAYDGNESTSSGGYAEEIGWGTATDTEQEIWSGFPAFTKGYTGAQLAILNNTTQQFYPGSGPAPWGYTEIDYSLDGGVTWTNLLSTNSTTSKVYTTVALPLAQDFTQVQVRATVGAEQSGNWTPPPHTTVTTPSVYMSHFIYEIHIALSGVS